MPLRYCTVPGCQKVGVRGFRGHCLLCERRFCVSHVHPDVNTCPTSTRTLDLAIEAEIAKLASRINLKALATRASSLRSGLACKILPLSFDADNIASHMGGKHYHIPIAFEDGSLNVLISEAATLDFLSRTRIPVPTLHDFATEGADNPVGVGYILIGHVNGSPLEFYSATPDQQHKVLQQLADIFIEVEKYPFSSIGSLCEPGSELLGGRTEDDTADLDSKGNLVPFGPFTDTASYLTAKIKFHLDLIRRREVYAQSAVDAYLIHRYLSDTLVPAMPVTGKESFYLKHMDDKGDNILVDEDFNITAIIDWEWAQTASKAEAFCAPLFLLDVLSFYDGDNTLTDSENTFIQILEEKSRPDLAALVREGRYQHRIAFSIGGDVEDDSFQRLFEGFLKLQPGRERKPVVWAEWRSEVLAKYAGEKDLVLLTQEERTGRDSSLQ